MKITVKVRTDIGDPGHHEIYGPLKPGSTVTIEEEHFGPGLFERPAPEYLSPHEAKDKERAEKEERPVGGFAPPSKDAPVAKDKPAKEK